MADRSALTSRETRTLAFLSHGMTLAQAATEMHVSRETLKDATQMARLKLEAKTTLHACCIALRRGLIQ